MQVQAPRNLKEAVAMTDSEARRFLEAVRWPNGPVCAHCQSKRCKELKGKAHREGVYKCYECSKQFTVTVGTLMHRSHISLSQWIAAFYSICSHKKGVSALQLQRDLGLGSYKSAWHLAHRIRLAMTQEPLLSLLGTVEVDETFVGGKGSPKTSVVAMIERGGRAKSKKVPDRKGKTLLPEMQQAIEPDATIMTDEHGGYVRVYEHFYQHETVNHLAKEYARGEVHINTCESYFALLKRGVHGTFHHISEKHTDRYCEEFSFRWNHRKTTDGERMLAAVCNFPGRRLEYKTLIGKNE